MLKIQPIILNIFLALDPDIVSITENFYKVNRL